MISKTLFRVSKLFGLTVIALTIFIACRDFKEPSGRQCFPESVKIHRITSGPLHHFASAYYHLQSWSASERYLLCLETDLANHNPEADEPATLGMVDLERGEFIPLAKTYAWNFQQGTMQHWLGRSPDSLIIYNDFRNGRFVSVILNVHTKKEIKIIGRPVSAVSHDGRKAVSLNFARLSITRPGYGYSAPGDDPRIDIKQPEDDGLYYIDLETGESKLIVSIAEIYRRYPLPPEVKDPLFWFNHTLINTDDTRVFFMARTNKPNSNALLTAGYTVNLDGTDLRQVIGYKTYGASHFDWLSPEKLMVTTYHEPGGEWSHVLFTDGKQDFRVLGPGILIRDGHGAFSPDGCWMVTDTYPDYEYKRTLLLMNMANDAVMPLGRFFHDPQKFSGPCRCDLHPRWNHSGDKLCFDSVHEGTRQVYIADLDFGR